MYNKLFTSILDSSIWLESNATRIVWVTLLAAMDQDGFARFASVRNLANRAVVSNEDAAEAVRCLEGPDEHAPNQPHEGRRIERVEGGWMILNAAKYREMSTAIVARERNRVRVAEHRAKVKGVTLCNGVYESVTKCAPSEAETEAETEAVSRAAHALAPTPASRGRSRPSDPLRWSDSGWEGISDADRAAWAVAYPAVDIDRQLAAADQWLRANPAKAKKSLWRRFVTTWLARTQERGGDAASVRPAQPRHDILAQLARINAEDAAQ